MGEDQANRTFGHAPYKKSIWTRVADIGYKSATIASVSIGLFTLSFIAYRVGYFYSVERPQARAIEQQYAAALQQKEETEKKAGLR